MMLNLPTASPHAGTLPRGQIVAETATLADLAQLVVDLSTWRERHAAARAAVASIDSVLPAAIARETAAERDLTAARAGGNAGALERAEGHAITCRGKVLQLLRLRGGNLCDEGLAAGRITATEEAIARLRRQVAALPLPGDTEAADAR